MLRLALLKQSANKFFGANKIAEACVLPPSDQGWPLPFCRFMAAGKLNFLPSTTTLLGPLTV